VPRFPSIFPGPFRARRAAEAVFCAAALGFLLSFPVRTLLHGNIRTAVTLDGENREAAPFPDFRALPAAEWGKSIETWYGDAMPSRRLLIRRARSISTGLLRSPFGVYVPGRRHQRFRSDPEWPEMPDYLGLSVLPDTQLERWADLFAGRRAWAEAMGCTFLSVVSPPKVQTMPDSPYPWLSAHRGRCLFDQLEAFLASRGETGNILPLRGALHSPADGHPLFSTGKDHHPDAEGLYRIYEAIAAAIPGCGVVPWHGEAPPPDVAAGRTPGCWSDGDCLHVSAPGSAPCGSPFFDLTASGEHGNRQSTAVRRGEGGGLHVVMAHTSYLRFTFSSWQDLAEPVRFPFDASVGRVDSLLWKCLGEADLDYITTEAVPDAIVQEINEWQLARFPVGWCGAIRNAAAFSRAAPLDPASPPSPETPVCVCAILTDVEAGGLRTMPLKRDAPQATVNLVRDGQTVASMSIRAGVRRPVFFDPVAYGNGDFRIETESGSARFESLSVRVPPR
jgi:hypothetical protein